MGHLIVQLHLVLSQLDQPPFFQSSPYGLCTTIPGNSRHPAASHTKLREDAKEYRERDHDDTVEIVILFHVVGRLSHS